MTKYNEFITRLGKTNIPSAEYYEELVKHKDAILLDIAKTNQGVVAKKLNMHHTKLSALCHILRLNITLVPNGNNSSDHNTSLEVE